ncbi:nucleotidyltransferase family protein [Thiohalobacter thiocyanaticus]|uniref:nucleotidyltransferase family protein n=1 Tax=Thiohalobacter thiocyanaticus TaxID=585455 RepID=UPI0019D48CF0|nr:nucleotidyltransferase family protein [Thiohalobacter thiocyanaticus]
MDNHPSDPLKAQDPTAGPAASPRFTCVILAGERSRRDALREHSGVACRALLRISSVPMIHRVISALRGADSVGSIRLSGPDSGCVQSDAGLAREIDQQRLAWSPPEASPSTSAYRMLSEMPDANPVLITTADHPLLTSEIVDRFCRDSVAAQCDVLVGLAPYELVKSRYPDLKKTVLRFRDGNYCGCNLFAFMTPEGRRAADFWRRIENQRKKPLLVIGLLGWWAVIRYRLGLLTLDAALSRLSRHLGLRLGAVILPYANAAVDVDSVADYDLVQRYAGTGTEMDPNGEQRLASQP